MFCKGTGSWLQHRTSDNMNAAWEKRQYILREGRHGIQAFRELRYQRIYLVVKVFDGEKEVVEDAKWGTLKTTGIEARGVRDSS